MAYYRKLFTVLVCACFLDSALICHAAQPDEEQLPDDAPPGPSAVEEVPPAEEPDSGGGEVVVEDGSNVYRIEADTVIIQPLPADPPPEDDPEEEDDPPEPIQEDDPDIAAYALGEDGFPFYGSCWVRGYASSLGNALLLFPMNYKDGYIGLDSSGRIFNVSNNSWTGVLYVGNTSYTVNFGAWGLPTYRVYNGSGYQNVTLYLTPEDTDLLLPDGPSPVYHIPDLLPYAAVLLLGGVFICCMKKS